VATPEKTSTAIGSLVGKNEKIRVGRLKGIGKLPWTVCVSYYDGTVVYGLEAEDMEHPATRISFSGQNSIQWIAKFPFTVKIQTELPERLFYRMPAWQSVMGPDKLHRVQTGPLNPEKVGEIKAGTELKYSIFKRLDPDSPAQDPECEALDPHIIVEP
jgi:hypothetical protein